MFIQAPYRGNCIGVTLLQLSLDLAINLGYKKVRLDTLEDIIAAKRLYKTLGFYEISVYRYNPIEGAVFMEKELTISPT